MRELLTLDCCPSCGAGEFTLVKQIEDHSVSKELFTLSQCTQCGLVFTNPRPSENDLPSYYKSDQYISHTNKGNTLINKMYKLARIVTIRWKYRLIGGRQIQSLLDYGSGTGTFATYCANKGIQTTAFEPDDQARSRIQKHDRLSIISRIEELPSIRFEAISLWHVIEHVMDIHSTLNSLIDRLESNGNIYIAVPNHRSYDASFYGESWAAYDVPRHLYHFDEHSMGYLLNNHGLIIEKIVPMKLDAYYVCMLSALYKTESKNFASSFFIATKSNYFASKNKQYSSLIYVAKKRPV